MIFLPWKGISKIKLVYGHMSLLLPYIYLPTSLFVVPLTQISIVCGKSQRPSLQRDLNNNNSRNKSRKIKVSRRQMPETCQKIKQIKSRWVIQNHTESYQNITHTYSYLSTRWWKGDGECKHGHITHTQCVPILINKLNVNGKSNKIIWPKQWQQINRRKNKTK